MFRPSDFHVLRLHPHERRQCLFQRQGVKGERFEAVSLRSLLLFFVVGHEITLLKDILYGGIKHIVPNAL